MSPDDTQIDVASRLNKAFYSQQRLPDLFGQLNSARRKLKGVAQPDQDWILELFTQPQQHSTHRRLTDANPLRGERNTFLSEKCVEGAKQIQVEFGQLDLLRTCTAVQAPMQALILLGDIVNADDLIGSNNFSSIRRSLTIAES